MYAESADLSGFLQNAREIADKLFWEIAALPDFTDKEASKQHDRQ